MKFFASNVAEDLIEPIVSSIISNVRSQLSATYAVEHNGEVSISRFPIPASYLRLPFDVIRL